MDYQEVIELIAECIKIAMPLGLVIGLAEWAVSFFINTALGKFKK